MTVSEEKYEAIVVGGGPAGLSAAMELAKNGVQTLILERGATSGQKPITGGVLYGQTNTPYNLEHLIPDFASRAPLERPIDGYTMHAMAGDKVKEVDMRGLHEHDMKWSYSILRNPFDKWFADEVHKEARKSGGGVLTGVRVKGPLMENGQVVGVETDELDPIRADLVIAADGATSDLVRKSGMRGWMQPDRWFQGVKVVVKMPEATIEERFGLENGRGAAHLFAGDVFKGVRGGGFLYTNKDTLSIGTVFHLDALMESRIETHSLLDSLLHHSLLSKWIGDDYEELEYSAKLVPDGKKALMETPYKGRLLAVGDAAGQMLAHGPVIKGMNLGITAGILAARGYIDAKAAGKPLEAGSRYTSALRDSYVFQDMRPMRYKIMRAFLENKMMNGLMEGTLKSGLGRWFLKTGFGEKQITSMMNSPYWASAMPDIRFGYNTLPTVLADVHGTEVDRKGKYATPSLDERIAALNYATAIGKPHIRLLDNSPQASGAATWCCPVSSRESSRGCYREETVKAPGGGEKRLIALDTQPCIECGTCGVVAKTDWDTPPGGKGVAYKYG